MEVLFKERNLLLFKTSKDFPYDSLAYWEDFGKKYCFRRRKTPVTTRTPPNALETFRSRAQHNLACYALGGLILCPLDNTRTPQSPNPRLGHRRWVLLAFTPPISVPTGNTHIDRNGRRSLPSLFRPSSKYRFEDPKFLLKIARRIEREAPFRSAARRAV